MSKKQGRSVNLKQASLATPMATVNEYDKKNV